MGGRGWRAPVVLFADPDSVADGLRWTGSAGPRRARAARSSDYRHTACAGGDGGSGG